jgi:hypothetical protein
MVGSVLHAWFGVRAFLVKKIHYAVAPSKENYIFKWVNMKTR